MNRLAVANIPSAAFSGLGDRFDDICGKDFGRPAGGDYGDPGERPSAASRDLESRPDAPGFVVLVFLCYRGHGVPTSVDA